MASEVKRAQYGILKILLRHLEAFRVRNLSSLPLGVRRFLHYGVAARRLHQTANRGQSRLALRLDQPAAGLRPAPQKILRTPRRLFKTAGSRGKARGEFLVGSTRGQPRGQVFQVHSNRCKAEPARGQSKRRGRERWRMGASRDLSSPTLRCSQHPLWRSSQAASVRPVRLPGAVGFILRPCVPSAPRPWHCSKNAPRRTLPACGSYERHSAPAAPLRCPAPCPSRASSLAAL